MKFYCKILPLLFFFFTSNYVKGEGTILKLNDSDSLYHLGLYVEILEDKANVLTIEDILNSEDFSISEQFVPNLQISNSTFWVRFTVKNSIQDESNFLLTLMYPIIDTVILYTLHEEGITKLVLGESIPFSLRKHQNQNFVFDVNVKYGKIETFYLKIRSNEQIMLPLTVASPKRTYQAFAFADIINGIYIGVVLVMILYNLFVYLSVKDKSYLYYVFYIFFIGMTQLSDQGYSYRFLWPESPVLADFLVSLFPVTVGISAMLFMRVFLSTKKFFPKSEKIFFFLIGMYLTTTVLKFVGLEQIGYQLLQSTALFVSIFMFVLAFKIMRKGYKPAKFFLFAWSVFLMSICVFILKDFGLLPYNNLTKFSLHIGSGIELVLLSIALADKINIMKKEKEVSQAKALEILEENERIIREQNVMLEKKVTERTHELQETNQNLSVTLTELKETQSQLVDAEKMASLGQLTAGIAHEINNPINFVISNINPLKRDIQDLLEVLDKYAEISEETDLKEKLEEIRSLKAEIDIDYVLEEVEMLLKGMEEGADRTSEIVKGLRAFSRLDETDLKTADINKSLDSTLLLLKSAIGDKINIIKNFDKELPAIECYSGKLNQLFMNMINNAIHAVNKKEYSINEKQEITVSTKNSNELIIIAIQDNGIGMDEQTKKRIFEPFFTTKDVGEGTGLGLSIAYNIIEKHNGRIEINSESGVGTEFRISIPKNLSQNGNDEKERIEKLKAERKDRLREGVKHTTD